MTGAPMTSLPPHALPRIAGRLFNTPLLMMPETALTVASALSERLGLDLDGPAPLGARGFDALAVDRGGDPDDGDAPYSIHEGVATIPIHGELVNRGSWLDAYSGLVSYSGLGVSLQTAAADPAVSGILLDVDSGGGEFAGCIETAAIVRAVSEVKPISVFVNGACCSAAYALSAGASDITVSPSAIVGSIGVMMLHLDRSGALGKAGVKPTIIHAGAFKADGHSTQPLDDGSLGRLQAMVDESHALFVGSVAEHRDGMSEAAVRATEAGVYLGAEAVRLGLADRVGTLDDALARLPQPAPATAGAVPTPFRGITMAALPTETISRNSHTAALEAAAAAARTEGERAGAASERARISGILGHAEATERGAQARHLAFETDMAAEGAVALLKASAKEGASAPAGKKHRLDAIVPVPPVGGDAPEDEPKTEAERGAAAFASARGVKPAGR